MKKIQDFNHSYKGFGNCDSECRVTIWEDATKNVVLFTDLGKGTSVTNFSEHLANQIKGHLTKGNVRFFETYPHSEQPDEITYDMRGGQYCVPSWKPITSTAFQNLVDQ